MERIKNMTEDQARIMTVCPRCKKEKSQGLVVCWNCFKYIPNAFKFFQGSLAQWLSL